MKLFIKIIKMFLIILLILAVIVILFLKFYIPFGGKISKEDKLEYAKRASNYIDGKFHNVEDFKLISNDKNEINNYMKIVSSKNRIPEEKLPYMMPMINDKKDIDKLYITWLGHSTILVEISGMKILFDPVFSNRTSPFSFIGGSTRFSEMPIGIDDLPDIDIVIITHDHYDHLDYKTIKEIDSKVDKYIVPLGIENHLVRFGVNNNKISNMAWWEEIDINGLSITCTPASHYSRRSIGDASSTLWSSWVLKNKYYQIFESGDTGYSKHFEQIRDKFGYFDFAMFDNAQYNYLWRKTHMNPEEAIKAAKLMNVKIAMPIHFGAFSLSPHPWDDPVDRFTSCAKMENLNYVTPLLGQTMDVDNYKDYQVEWWKDIK